MGVGGEIGAVTAISVPLSPRTSNSPRARPTRPLAALHLAQRPRDPVPVPERLVELRAVVRGHGRRPVDPEAPIVPDTERALVAGEEGARGGVERAPEAFSDRSERLDVGRRGAAHAGRNRDGRATHEG